MASSDRLQTRTALGLVGAAAHTCIVASELDRRAVNSAPSLSMVLVHMARQSWVR